MRSLSLVFLFALTTAASAQAPSAEVMSSSPATTGAPDAEETRDLALYAVELPVSSQEARERQMALARGLSQVITRLTGVLEVAENPAVQSAMRGAEGLLASSEYRDVEESVAGVPVLRQRLLARFNPETVDAVVLAAGLPQWPAQRSKPMLWFVIDDGRGPRLVTSQQLNVVKPLATRGVEIGLRVLLPVGNAIETEAVTALQAQQLEAAAVLTQRYGQSVQLLGRMSRASEGWAADWVLARGSEELSRWRFADASPQRVIASGADGAMVALAKQEARPAAPVQPESLQARFDGLNSQDDWLRLTAALQTSPLVRAFVVERADATGVQVRVDLLVGRLAFEQWLQASGLIATPEPAVGGALRYRMRRS